MCPVLQAIHTPLFRQATGACVETVTENMGLSRNPAVIWPVPETSPSCVVAGGQMLYTESPFKVIFKYLSFSPIRQAFPYLWQPEIYLYRHAVSVLGLFSSPNLSVFACLSPTNLFVMVFVKCLWTIGSFFYPYGINLVHCYPALGL